MKLFVKRILFCAIIIIGIIAALILRIPFNTQTDLMSLVTTNNVSQQWPIDKISNNFSSVINIVTESENEQIAQQSAHKIVKLLNTEQFNTLNVQSDKFSLKELTNDLIPYKNGLLSAQDKEILKQNKFKQIADTAIKQISESLMPPLVSLRDDPFMLLSNYILNINNANSGWTINNDLLWQHKDAKNYFMIPVDIDMQNKDSINQINLLHKQLSNQNSENLHIYISGVPLHTAIMVHKSQIQLTILSIFAALMAVLFSYLLFKNILTVATVLGSLLLGFLCGTIALFLCFNNPHILTFVFGTTLIGLGIDYSFHFLTRAALRNKRQIKTNMQHSFLTTLVCFLPLMFSGVSLLQQISIFTIVGLSGIYIGLNLFVPDKLDLETKSLKFKFSLSHKSKISILTLIGIIIITTLPFIKIENNINQLYRPDSEIATQESIVQKLNNTQQSAVLMVRGTNIQEVLETEENIKHNNHQFFSLSDITPSIKTQTKNQELIQQLYSNQSSYLKQKLELRNMPVFAETQYLTPDNIKSKFLRQWIDKMMITDGQYVYSLAQISPDIQINNDNARVVSVSETLSQQIKEYSHKTYWLLGICALCLIALLSRFYKKRAVIYLIPSVMAILLSVCILTWFNQPITFFHMLAFFIVTGLGLDYTIFNINTNNNKEMRPVLFSFLTSFVGFGLLSFTSFFLIKSMGITLGLGLALSYLISLFLFRTNQANIKRIR